MTYNSTSINTCAHRCIDYLVLEGLTHIFSQLFISYTLACSSWLSLLSCLALTGTTNWAYWALLFVPIMKTRSKKKEMEVPVSDRIESVPLPRAKAIRCPSAGSEGEGIPKWRSPPPATGDSSA